MQGEGRRRGIECDLGEGAVVRMQGIGSWRPQIKSASGLHAPNTPGAQARTLRVEVSLGHDAQHAVQMIRQRPSLQRSRGGDVLRHP